MHGAEFGVQGLEFVGQSLGFRVQNLGFRVIGSPHAPVADPKLLPEYRLGPARAPRLRLSMGFRFRVQSLGFRV